jgi:hypothetical protein
MTEIQPRVATANRENVRKEAAAAIKVMCICMVVVHDPAAQAVVNNTRSHQIA